MLRTAVDPAEPGWRVAADWTDRPGTVPLPPRVAPESTVRPVLLVIEPLTRRVPAPASVRAKPAPATGPLRITVPASRAMVVAWPRVMEPLSVLSPLTFSTASALDELSVIGLGRVIPPTPASWSEAGSSIVTGLEPRALLPPAWTVPAEIVVPP